MAAKKQIHEKHDFFLRGVSLVDISVLDSVLSAQEKRNAELIAALEGTVQAVQEKCADPGLKNEAKKTLRSIRALRIAQRSVPRLLKASMRASVEHHNPIVGFASDYQLSIDDNDNAFDLVQDFLSTLRVTVVRQDRRLVLWNDTSKSCICTQDDNRADNGAVVHLCVNTAESPRVISFTFWLSVIEGKPEVTAAANEFDHKYGNYFHKEPRHVLEFARLRYCDEVNKA